MRYATRAPSGAAWRYSYRHHAAVIGSRVQLRPAGRRDPTTSAFLLSTGANVAKHAALASTPVTRVADSKQIRLTELWGTDEMCVVVFARSFGCPFCQYVSASHFVPYCAITPA